MPSARAPASMAAVKSGCSSGSPPDTVNPPPDAATNAAYRVASSTTAEALVRRPVLPCHVSGLWQ